MPRPKRKVTEDQKSKLLEMVRIDRWTFDKFKELAYKHQKARWWNKTSAVLNAIPGGALKTPRQWEKTFKDLRLHVKKKEVEFRNNSTTETTKEAFHQQMLELLEADLQGGGLVANENTPGVQEDVQFPYSVPNMPFPKRHRRRRNYTLADETLDECRGVIESQMAGLERIARAQELMLESQKRNAATFSRLVSALSNYLDAK